MTLKDKKKLFYIIPAAVVIVLIGTYSLLRFAFSIDIFDRSGWHQNGSSAQYLDYFGNPQLQWQSIEGKTYYFDPQTGNMVTGWQELNGGRYLFDAEGVLVTGWHTEDGKKYYLNDSGKMQTAWQTLDGKQYYFGEDGAMATGWLVLDNQQHYLSEDGTPAVGWLALGEKQYYFSEDGVPLTGWLTLDGKHFFFAADGARVSGWQEIDSSRYLFNAEGALVTGWHTEDGKKYYLNDDGKMQTGWLKLEKKQYFFGENGTMQTGWLTYDGNRYYLKSDGSMAIGEVKIDGVSSFFTSTGKYVLMTNPWHPIPSDFKLDLVTIGDYKFDRSGRDALQEMIDDCRAAGHSCKISNTYRTHGTQQYLWDHGIEKRMAAGMTYEEALTDTARSVMIPGHSEHETGLAVDISGNDAMDAWLAEHCWDYGFILRYPDDRVAVTGIKYEPWHFRYVGKELSLELEELGLCMEEYMDMLTKQQAAD
mgnify:CR=1 FL=1